MDRTDRHFVSLGDRYLGDIVRNWLSVERRLELRAAIGVLRLKLLQFEHKGCPGLQESLLERSPRRRLDLLGWRHLAWGLLTPRAPGGP